MSGRTALPSHAWSLGIWALSSALVACGGGAGDEDTDILMPFSSLSTGVVFASKDFEGSSGYDLYWAPVPVVPTVASMPVTRLTNTGGNEWQPSVSAGGKAIAFARQDEGIFLITESGRIKRISDVSDSKLKDSLPAVSADGLWVAWTREDLDRPIGESGFSETYIMLAKFDGSDARPISPSPGVVQDAAAFEPRGSSTKIAWSEFNATTVDAGGPRDYAIQLHDFQTGTSRPLCTGDQIVGNAVFRCFGQHLAWPLANALVLPQTFFEIYVDGSASTSSYEVLLDSMIGQQVGMPHLEAFPNTPPGFFRAFPLSASYQGSTRMILDGVVTFLDGDAPTLGLIVASVDGSEVWRLVLDGQRNVLDAQNTAGYLFSVATPQFIP
jgi:hypothetical protein